MICSKCNKYEVVYRNECKVCGFKKRRKDDIGKVLSCGYWNIEELEVVIYHMLYCTYDCINKIAEHLENKNLMDLAILLTTDLKILGMTPSKIKLKCEVCDKEYLINISRYMAQLGTHTYCSFDCRNKGFVLFGSHSGENNSRYNSEYINCTNCGNKYLAPKYKQEQTNSYGENNHYCSQECYWEYRSKHYIGEKNFNYGKTFSEEQLEKMSINTTKRICSGKFKQTETKPHLAINKVLKELKIAYTNEFNLKYQALDIYLDSHNLGIEIMGDYWHGNPNKYKLEDLNKTQLKDKKQDKRKHTYTKQYHGFEILYLWEYDINKNIDICEKLIELYIKNNGILQDYNSFNYYVNGSELLLKSEIVYPYFIKSNP